VGAAVAAALLPPQRGPWWQRVTAWLLIPLCAAALLALTAGCATLMVTGAVDPAEAATEAAALAERTRQALRDDASVDSRDISVSASGNVITLNGRVPSSRQRDQAVRTAAAVSGVGRVVNRLTVGGA
jgi:hypothetical protein